MTVATQSVWFDETCFLLFLSCFFLSLPVTVSAINVTSSLIVELQAVLTKQVNLRDCSEFLIKGGGPFWEKYP